MGYTHTVTHEWWCRRCDGR